ncbi:MAG TPA: hypothetical protein VGF77_12520 [Allosphingosinicella sp.]|jgi:hypothetical protein
MGEKADPAAGRCPEAPRAFINHMRLDLSLCEVKIDLGQVSPDEAAPRVQGRFVTSPDYLLGMQSRISGAIDLYQETFGAIAGGGLPGEMEVDGHG